MSAVFSMLSMRMVIALSAELASEENNPALSLVPQISCPAVWMKVVLLCAPPQSPGGLLLNGKVLK